jgi:hypothetical protein
VLFFCAFAFLFSCKALEAKPPEGMSSFQRSVNLGHFGALITLLQLKDVLYRYGMVPFYERAKEQLIHGEKKSRAKQVFLFQISFFLLVS